MFLSVCLRVWCTCTRSHAQATPISHTYTQTLTLTLALTLTLTLTLILVLALALALALALTLALTLTLTCHDRSHRGLLRWRCAAPLPQEQHRVPPARAARHRLAALLPRTTATLPLTIAVR